MFKKLGLIFIWPLLVVVVVLSSGILLYQHKKISNYLVLSSTPPHEPNELSQHVNGTTLGVKIEDMRPYLVGKFLKGTPLEPYAQTMIDVADKYQIDYRLIPAIAMKESGAGRAIKEGSFNAWGFENGHTVFQSWKEAIDNVGKTLSARYVKKGLVTPDQIMPVYAPPQLLTGGKWAKDVNFFFTKIEPL